MSNFRLGQKVGRYKGDVLQNFFIQASRNINGKETVFVDGDWYDAVTGTSVDSVLSYITERLSDI